MILNVCLLQATRMAEELRQEQDHAKHLDKIKKNNEVTIKELQLKVEEAELFAMKAGKRTIQKMEVKVCQYSYFFFFCLTFFHSHTNTHTKTQTSDKIFLCVPRSENWRQSWMAS